MSRIKKKFGFYPNPLEVKTGSIRVSTLPELDEHVEGVLSSESVYKNWIYPLRGPSSVRIFGLPKTHMFEHTNATGENHVEFHIWALSFFLGMRLTTTEAGYIDATPVKPGYFVDFTPVVKLEPAIKLADQFWMANRGQPRNTQRFAAAVHALFLGHYPKALQYESFIYLYTAIDACYALTKALRQKTADPRHSERIEWMCNELGIQTPSWARKTAGAKGTLMSALRNDALHEALFDGEPLGFKVNTNTATNLTLEMRNLICRLLVALLGGKDNTYLGSPVNTRDPCDLSLT